MARQSTERLEALAMLYLQIKHGATLGCSPAGFYDEFCRVYAEMEERDHAQNPGHQQQASM